MAVMKKLAIASAATAAAFALSAPVASADIVDDYLAKVPAGQISCEQAQAYWTNSGDYNSKRSQALAAANFHPRGGEIRSTIARVDEAVARCGLAGTTGNAGGNAAANNAGNQSNASNAGNTSNAGKPAPAPAAGPVIPVAVIPGQPTFDVQIPVANVTLRLPDLAQIVQAQIAQFAQGSSF